MPYLFPSVSFFFNCLKNSSPRWVKAMKDVATGCSITAKMDYKTFCRVLLPKIAMHWVEKIQRGRIRSAGTTVPSSYNGENTPTVSPHVIQEMVSGCLLHEALLFYSFLSRLVTCCSPSLYSLGYFLQDCSLFCSLASLSSGNGPMCHM